MDNRTATRGRKKDLENRQSHRFSSFFGRILKRHRMYTGMSQADVAVESGIDQSHLCTIETKTVDFSLNTMHTICSGMKISLAESAWLMELFNARQSLNCRQYESWHRGDLQQRADEKPLRIADQDQP